jgi:hypothetical protein
MQLDGVEYNVDEHAVLEKFEGDPADGKLLERITLHNGEIVSRETFTLEGGDYHRSN